MKLFDRYISLGLILTLGFLLGILGFSIWDKPPSPVDRVNWSPEVQWIAHPEPSYRFYARHSFYIPDGVQAGWLRISADNDFALYINGQGIGQEVSILRNTVGLVRKFSEYYEYFNNNQYFNDSNGYRAPNSPGFFLANAKDWKVTAYVDLSRYLVPGKNVIALEVQKSEPSARVVVEGKIYPVSEESAIKIATGATSWRVSKLSETRQGIRWFEANFADNSWLEARAVGSVREATYSRLSPHMFDRFIQGDWITGSESSQGEIWLRKEWLVPAKRKRAFLRFAGDGEYALLINGKLVKRFRASDYRLQGSINLQGQSNHDLRIFEVTNFLQTGRNIIGVRLARPLSQYESSGELKPLGFVLDGWVEAEPNKIAASIATDDSWQAVTQPVAGWAERKSGDIQPVSVLGKPDPQGFLRVSEGDAYPLDYPDYLARQSLWQLGAIACASIYASILGRFWLGRDSWWDSFGAGAGLLLPGTLYLIGIGLLKHRYAEAEQGLLFAQPQSNSFILLGFVGVVLLTLLWNQIQNSFENRGSAPQTLPHWGLWFLLGLTACIGFGILGIASSWSPSLLLVILGFAGIALLSLLWRQRRFRDRLTNSLETVRQAWPTWGHWLLLTSIVTVGFALRAYDLDFIDLDADENTSFDAILGILRTGAPEPASGIWYTRGPFYHYMVALWLRLVGDAAVNARFLSVLWGTATLVLVFILARKITGKVWIALIVTAIMAIDPWEIWYSRYIRFYQLVQFLTILNFWLFLKGFTEETGRRYQYAFFIGLTLMLLTQEVTVTLLPGFLLGFLFFYRPFRLSVDWPIVLGSLITVSIFSYNIVFFIIRCLTPLVALSGSTASYMRPHLSEVNVFFTLFFTGANRGSTIYTFFFFLGLAYFLKRRDGKSVFLFSCVLINIVLLTLLLYQVALRYTYPIYPLFITLAVYSAFSLTENLGMKMKSVANNLMPLKAIACGLVILLLIGNLDPGRVLAAYQSAINKRNTLVTEYIRDRLQPGDVLITATPFPAAIVLGGLDYYLMPAFRSSTDFPFDTVYERDGRVIDRWAGGEVISNVDQLSRVLEKANRVWIMMDDYKIEGETVEPILADYIQTLGRPVMETFGSRLRLWQRDDGILPRVPNQGQDFGSY